MKTCIKSLCYFMRRVLVFFAGLNKTSNETMQYIVDEGIKNGFKSILIQILFYLLIIS